MFKTSLTCPLGDPKKCKGTQQKNKEGCVMNVCAFCEKTKKRLLK